MNFDNRGVFQSEDNSFSSDDDEYQKALIQAKINSMVVYNISSDVQIPQNLKNNESNDYFSDSSDYCESDYENKKKSFSSCKSYFKVKSSVKTEGALLAEFIETITDEPTELEGFAADASGGDTCSVINSDVEKIFYDTCMQCKNPNTNPSYPYCEDCFQLKKTLFPLKGKSLVSKNSSFQGPSGSQCTQESESTSQVFKIPNSQTSQDCSLLDSQESVLSQDVSDFERNKSTACIICNTNPKDSVFIHGKTGHICCCYSCADKLNRCPYCNRNVTKITKIFFA